MTACREGYEVNGWRVIAPTTRRKGTAHNKPHPGDRIWLLECPECWGRVSRTANVIIGGDLVQMAPCTHPAVDESTPFAADPVAKRIVHWRGEQSLEEVGEAMHISRERVRQIEVKALRKLRALPPEVLKNLRAIWQAIEERPGDRTVWPEEVGYVEHDEIRDAYVKFAEERGLPVTRKWRTKGIKQRGYPNDRLLDPEFG